jgi:hypothetical protein
MFGGRITLFTVLGFTVRMDASWLFIAALLTWSLAAGVSPATFPDLPARTYWWMGIAGCLGLLKRRGCGKAEPALLCRRGRLLDAALRRERISEDEVRAAARSQGLERSTTPKR